MVLPWPCKPSQDLGGPYGEQLWSPKGWRWDSQGWMGVGVSLFSSSLNPSVHPPPQHTTVSITESLHPSYCSHLLAFAFLSIPTNRCLLAGRSCPLGAALSGSCPSPGSWGETGTAPQPFTSHPAEKGGSPRSRV